MQNIDATKITLIGTRDEQTGFCRIWPSTKAGLEALAVVINNPIVKGVISIVISAGDAVSSRICGN